MRKYMHLLAAVCFLASAAFSPVRAEIQLPADIMQAATEGINGVYSLDFATAEKNIAFVFEQYPDHPLNKKRGDCLCEKSVFF